MSKTVVHMIGQAHLDPVWLWRWTEGRAEALGTSQSAVDRLAEYPDFHFTRGESQVYAWIEAENPALFAQIQQLIADGRWHVVNGMVIQPDMNLPSGESFVRQVLLGKRYMRQQLGVEPTIAYCVDSFGHAGTLPQILRKCGFDGFVFMRPGPHEKELPANVFWWQGPDGSRILTFRIAEAYTTRGEEQEGHILAAVAAKPEVLDATMCFFGVGNHGGGPTKAQIENIMALAKKHGDGETALDIRFSWPDAYFDAIHAQAAALPTVADELQYHAVGCYSVNSALKRAHRQAENRLLLAERLGVMARLWADKPTPQTKLDELWRTLAFNQFHDTLGGSSLKVAEDDAIAELTGLAAAAEMLADDAGRAIASRIDASGPGATVVFFNPAAQSATTSLEYEPWTGWEHWDERGWGLVDDEGQPVLYQDIDPIEALSEPKGRIRRLLFATTLPACGYRLFRFAPGLPRADAPVNTLRVTETELENERLHIRLDPQSGAIVSCLDKRAGLELVGPGGWNVGEVIDDPSDTWSHGVQRYGAALGSFGDATITVGERGPLRVSLLVERSYGASRWQQQILLGRGESAITIRNWLTWLEPWRLVKLSCDVNTPAPQAVHDVPFGWLERPCDGHEVPTHMWMDVSGPAAEERQIVGLGLLNDGKYGCDVSGSTLRLTVLRCVPYAYHEPHPFGARQRYDWVDQGSQEFTVVLRPHVGDWRASDMVARARTLNQPPLPVTMHSHPGDLPRQAEMASLDSRDVEVTAIKAAEDGNGFIVRVADVHGRGAGFTLTWLGQPFALEVAPFEVATVRLSEQAGQWRMQQCDMLERTDDSL
ncbi:glycoside hydrolase family 38 C-terminal domain-containing protein [Caldilinea sp.]|uniref:alpha-mannosidase n=1 Tax=Caldilinea sp. TaxID=2293560 RepID=UPI002BF297E5|nr:glycoside hydrolase family 38 C-terminal domain-containing protein [Caldilinea sp.]